MAYNSTRIKHKKLFNGFSKSNTCLSSYLSDKNIVLPQKTQKPIFCITYGAADFLDISSTEINYIFSETEKQFLDAQTDKNTILSLITAQLLSVLILSLKISDNNKTMCIRNTQSSMTVVTDDKIEGPFLDLRLCEYTDGGSTCIGIYPEKITPEGDILEMIQSMKAHPDANIKNNIYQEKIKGTLVSSIIIGDFTSALCLFKKYRMYITYKMTIQEGTKNIYSIKFTVL